MFRPSSSLTTCSLTGACFLLVACAGGPDRAAGPALSAWPAGGVTPDLVFAPGDTVELVFHSAPELDRTATVAPDGTLRLPYIDPVPVAAATPETARLRLEAAYGEQLVDPSLDVLPVASKAGRVFVGGAVRSPGAFELEGPTDPLQALILAGGATDEAYLGEVVLMRRTGTGAMETRVIDLRAALATPDAADWFALERDDILYVPRSRIADQNRFVSQYIRNALPLDFFLAYDVSDSAE